MTVFIYTVKRLIRNKINLLLMLILPILPVIPIVSAAQSQDTAFRVGVADLDRTELTSAIIKHIEAGNIIIQINGQDMEKNLADSTIQYGLVIEKGFTDEVIGNIGGAGKIKGFGKKGADLSSMIRLDIDNFLSPVKDIAAVSGNDREKFYQGVEKLTDGMLALDKQIVEVPDKGRSRSALGLIIQFLMFSSVFVTTMLLTDKENKTLFRTLTAPIGMKGFMLQTILGFVAVTILQVVVIILFFVFALGVYPGNSVVNLIILLFAVSLMSISLGVAINSFAGNVVQACISGAGITVLMCLVGGAWGGVPSSGVLKSIGNITPVLWGMRGLDGLLNGGNLVSVMNEMFILLVFSIVFFLLGAWRKADIAK